MSFDRGFRYSLNKISEEALERCFRDGSLSYLTDSELQNILEYIRHRTPKGPKDISADVANHVLADIEVSLNKGYKKPPMVTYYRALGSLIKVRISRTVGKMLSATGRPNEGILGMTFTMRKRNEKSDNPIITVKSVIIGSEADRAGIKRNDRIIEIGLERVLSKRQAEELLKSKSPGLSFNLTFVRNNENKTVIIDPSDVADDAYIKETELADEAIWYKAIIPSTRERQIYLDIVCKAFRSIKSPISRVVLMLSIFTEMKAKEIYNISLEDKKQLISYLKEEIQLEKDEKKVIDTLNSETLKSSDNVKVMLHRAKRKFIENIILKVDEALVLNPLKSDIQIYNSLKQEAIKAPK